MALDSRTLTAIGTMSGTSFDGVDVALLETDGETVARFGPVGYRAYPNEERLLLQRALAAAASLTDRAVRPGPLAEAESLVTGAHFAADVIYSPLETEFIKAAKRAGARTMSGDGMLLHQGVEAFRIFTGITPDVARMRAGLKEEFAKRAELAATA